MQSLPHHRLKGFGYILIIATIFLFILYYNETNFNMNFIGSYEEYYKLSSKLFQIIINKQKKNQN